MKNSNGERPNAVRTMAPQRVYANTNLVTKPEVYNELLPLVGGTEGGGGGGGGGGGVGINRGQQIPQPFYVATATEFGGNKGSDTGTIRARP